MLFRQLFIASCVIFIINLGGVFNVDAPNVIEKGMFLLTAIAFIATRKIDYFNLSLMALACICVSANIFFLEYPYFSFKIFLNSLTQPIMIFALLACLPTEEDEKTITRFVSFLPILCSLIGIFYQIAGLRQAYGIEFATGLARFSGSLIPAYLSGLGLIGTFAAVHCLIRKDRFALIVCVLDFGILLLAGGRAALASTVFVCAGLVIMTDRISFISKIRMALVSAAGAAVLIVLLWDRIATRFFNSGDNGRNLMAEFLMGLNAQYPAGIGFGHQYFSVPDEVRIVVGSYAAHNDFLRLTVEIGAWPTFLFYVLYALAVLRIIFRKHQNGNIVILFAFLSFLFISRTDNALASPAEFPLVFIGYLVAISAKRDRNSVSDEVKQHRPSTDLSRRPKGIAPSIFPIRPS